VSVRIAFLGTPPPAVPALRALLAADDVEVAVVITNPDRPSGRGHKLTPPPVKVAALEAGVEVWQPAKPREVLDDLRALDLDACAVVAYGSILPQDVLDVGGRGFVNLHFSLLPAWRGAAPVQASVRAGDTETGVTCFVLEAGMDTGPVLTTATTRIGPDETAGELVERLAELGAPVLVQAIRGLVDGSLTPVPQDHDRATLAPKITPEDARIAWDDEAEVVARAVRAHNPMPGAHTTLRGDRLKVHRAVPVTGDGEPGRVIRVEEAGPVVACGSRALRLEEVQPAGKPRMAGPDFANGYRPEGEVLGS
jgi:methionyl-tRNA formyltransferase